MTTDEHCHAHDCPTLKQAGTRLLERLGVNPAKPKQRHPQFNRNNLPDPRTFWAGHGVTLPHRTGWVTVKCLFHEDRTASLSINTENGGFCCHACGAKGGDVLAAHRLLTGDSFVEAAKALGAWCRV